MSNEIILSVALCLGAIAVHFAYGKFSEFVGYIKKISKICSFLYTNKDSIAALSVSLDETLKGANKINQDAVAANAALVNEVIRLREGIDRFVGSVVPLPEPMRQEYTPEIMEQRFEDNYKELIVQGFDPEQARLKAAEYELETLGGNTMTEDWGIGA